MQIRDLAQGFETPSAEIANCNERAGGRLEDVEIIAAGLGSRAMFRRYPDLRQIGDRRRQKEFMRLLDQIELLSPGAEFESLFDRFTSYFDSYVFRLARAGQED